jgi:hypothetical protein
MRLTAEYSVTLEVFFDADRWNKWPSLRSQSVVCEMATVQERALCVGWLLRQNQSPGLNEITAHSSISNLRVTMQ